MTDEKPKKNRDGSTIESNEYIGLALAIIVPFIGLMFGIYLKSEGNRLGGRIIVVSLIAAVAWFGLIILV